MWHTSMRDRGVRVRRLGTWGLLLAACWLGPVAAAAAVDLSGEWKGRWESCETGHQGPLKATFCKLDGSRYQVEFRGRFFKLLPFRYSVVLNVVQHGDVVRLQGRQDLGRLFGTFCYDARADRCNFRADYRSADDHGVFRLERQ